MVKRSQYVNGKIPNFLPFSLPGWFHPYMDANKDEEDNIKHDEYDILLLVLVAIVAWMQKGSTAVQRDILLALNSSTSISLKTMGASKKKCSFNLDFVPKQFKLCSEANQKILDTFCEPTSLEFLVERGGV